MYAIFMTGGKQYKAEPGDVLRIEKIKGEAGDKVKLGDVIAFSDDSGSLKTGTPYLDATVNATITDAGRGQKVIIFKFKAKKNYRRKQGHRQPYTEIEIDNFTIDGKNVGKKPEKPKEEKVEEPAAEIEEAPVKEKKPAKAKAPKAEKAEKAEKTEEPAAAIEEAPVKEEKPAKAKAPKAEKAEEPAAEPEEAPVKEEKPAKAKASKAEKAKEPKEEKPVKAKAPKAEKAEKTEEPKEEKPIKAKAPEAEKAEPKAEDADLSKLTKADLTAKLDELGVKYLKSAKKEELIELLKSAGSK